jgi:hypothetical protein
MSKPVYVTIDTTLFRDDEQGTVKVMKRVGEEYFNRTFGDLLERMTDPGIDSYNDERYTPEQERGAGHIRDLLETGNRNPEQVQLYAFSNESPPTEIDIHLNDVIANYADKILREEVVVGESGELIRYHEIDLILSDNDSGGKK